MAVKKALTVSSPPSAQKEKTKGKERDVNVPSRILTKILEITI